MVLIWTGPGRILPTAMPPQQPPGPTAKPKPATDPQPKPLIEALAQASRLARQGDFGAARRGLDLLRDQLAQPERDRLAAFEDSFRLDRVVVLVAGLTGLAVGLIALSTLFH